MPIPAIKTATKEVVQRVGGYEAAASISRVGKSNLSDYGNRASPLIVPVDVAIVLDRCAQQPIILAAMAHAEGFALVPLHFGEGHIPKDMAEFTDKASQAIQRGFEALEDRRVDVHEAHEIARCMSDVIRVAEHIRGSMGKIISENKPCLVDSPSTDAA
ncbi:hypothetical protein [Acetobacter papayae]|uniref:hypothetical protein n=1 Tax=Acetobacter papayae TaxID=1076592 RepID=UPI0039E8D865